MINIEQQLLSLIKEYTTCTMYFCSSLKETYDTKGETLLRAVRTNLIPKEGVLPDGYLFNFHGGGCYFEFEGGYIDVDFGPNDRCDGFDSGRLYDFLSILRKKNRKYSLITDQDTIEETLNLLLERKYLIKPNVYPNPNLFYVNEDFINVSI